MPTASRLARFHVDKVSKDITVSVPKGIKDVELNAILAKLRGLTACPACASSGNRKIIFQQRFDDILNFDMVNKKVIK